MYLFNLSQVIKYGFAGACGTLMHYGWLLTMSRFFTEISPAYFAFSGALLGAGINYLLNYNFTFLSRKKHVAALPLFMTLAILNMLASACIVQTAVNFQIHYFVGQLIATAMCVPIGFIISKKVVFECKK